MCKRFLAMALLPILCGTLWACDSDDSKSGSEAEGECTKDEQCVRTDYPHDRGCLTISGKNVCKDLCASKADNEPVCYLGSGMAPDNSFYDSAIETCAKDDNGKRYLVDIQVTNCNGKGCDEATGLCK